MDEIEDLLTIYELDDSEYEEQEWDDKHDIWLDAIQRRKSLESVIRRRSFRLKSFLDADRASEARTVITYYSDESVASKKSDVEEIVSVAESRQISWTDSVLSLSNLEIEYPIPNPDIKSAFWILYPSPPVYTSDGVEKFYDYVDILKLAPISSLKRQLKTDRVILKYYGVDPNVIHPLSQALLFNTTVKILDLQDNILTPSACYHLNKLLMHNTVLNSLNLTACKIGVEGAMKLEEGIAISSALRELNLSRCNLRNDGFFYIARSVASNTLMKKLNISDNNLDEESAAYVQKILSSTESLECLNLSWNDFYTKEAIEQIFAEGLSKNGSLVELDMSWNAMGKNGVGHIRNFILSTKKLKYCDLSGNRFTDAEASQIAYVVSRNRSLLEFRFGKNPLRSEAVGGFIRALANDDFIASSPLKLLDLESYWSTKNALPVIEQLRDLKPSLTIKLAGILENFNIVGPDLKELFFKTANYEAMSVQNKKERRNFGHFVLSLEDKRISKAKFIESVEQAKIPISENLVKEIMNQFLVTKKSLDQAALKESYLSYFPDTKLPKPKPIKVAASKKESKKKKKGKSKKKSKGKSKKGKKK